MSGYYQRGMTEQQQRALSATLSPQKRQALLDAARAQLQPGVCWSKALSACSDLQAQVPGIDCQVLADGWIGDYDKMQAAFDALPDCPAPLRDLIAPTLIAASAVFLVGWIAWSPTI